MSFTPGPWAEIDRSSSYINIAGNPISAGSETAFEKVCRVIRHSPGEANARLIAAAPELLEMLKQSHEQLHKLVSVFVSNTDGAHAETTSLMREIRAAIEKAVQS